MTERDASQSQMASPEVALIVGGGPGVSASCARLFAQNKFRVAMAARNPNKPAMKALAESHGVRTISCDAADPAEVASLFAEVVRELGSPSLVVHNIDGRIPEIFRKSITEADPGAALTTLQNSAFSAFLIGQHAARLMLDNPVNSNGARGTIIFTNASAAFKGFPKSGAFAMACHAKAGLAQSMARELMPRGVHVANVPIDAAIGWTRPMAAARIASRAPRSMTTWPIPIGSQKPTCTSTDSIDRPGRSKSSFGPGPRNGDVPKSGEGAPR